MALGMDVGLGPGHIVLDGEPARLPQKGGRAPLQFSAHFYCRQTAGCTKINKMQQDATWYGVRPQPGDFVLDGDPSSPPLKVHSSNFCPMSVVAKRLGG